MKKLLAALAALLLSQSMSARVVRVEVRSRADLLGGKSFGLAGSYEKISGTLHFAVSPEDPHDGRIVDLSLAPINARGEVEFSADFFLITPKDPARASGSFLLEVPNRGGKAILALMNHGKSSTDPATAEDIGDGFLMRRGVSVAWVGWQWDVRRYPRVSDGTLVSRADFRFPPIPSLRPPARAHEAFRLDFGPRWKDGIVSIEPPRLGRPFPSLVPQADSDGNDLGGVRIPEMEVPVATDTGWNLREPRTGFPGERVSFIGSNVPFPKTRSDREGAKDPRPSLEERYGSRERYLGLYALAAMRLVHDRFLLTEDFADVLARGGAEWDEAMK